jgi:alpha-L-rhamnosidase
MNSYNHYAYGAIGDWMYRVVAGIDTKTDAPGYKQIVIKPTVGGNFQNVSADYETNYGKISSHWKVENGAISLDVEIPANTSATVYVPAKDKSKLLESGQPMEATATPGFLMVNIGSGVYHFSTVVAQP